MPLNALVRRKCISLSAAFSQGHRQLRSRRLVVRKSPLSCSSSLQALWAPQPLTRAGPAVQLLCCGPTNRVALRQQQQQQQQQRRPLSTAAAVPPGGSSHMPHLQAVSSEFLSPEELPAGTHLHLIVLNYILPQQTAQLWHRATTRICADGGANRLYDQIVEMLPGADPHTARSSFLPDLIKGDLDSVRPDVQAFYTGKGVPMIDLSSDQETTDLEKCLLFLEGRLRAMSEQHTPAAAAAPGQQQQEQRPMRESVVAAAAAGVSGNGMGHGAKAIGALTASQAPGGVRVAPSNTPSSTSNSSSFSAAFAGGGAGVLGDASGADTSVEAAAAAAGLDSSVVRPESSVHGEEPSNGAGTQQPHQQQQQQQQQKQHHNSSRHHGHHHNYNHHHHNQQQQPAVPQVVSGRIILLDRWQAGEEPTEQQQQQQQPPRSSLLGSPAAAAPAEQGDNSSSRPGSPSSSGRVLDHERQPAEPSSSGSSGGGLPYGRGSPAAAAAAAAGGGGGVFEVSASVLGSCEGPPPSKRLQQEHVILVLGALGGRLDHTLSNLNTLYCYRHLNMALWGDGNLVRLLRAGTARIQPARAEGPTCGLVPLARPATASSSGLKWDLDNTHMCFRGLLSTSNIISSNTITVSTDEDLLWITAVEDKTALSG